MRSQSLQYQSLVQAFGTQGWHCNEMPEREVVEARFEAHHTSIQLHAQVFTPLNAISVVGETPYSLDEERWPYFFELVMRTNKTLTIGSFEFDIDRSAIVFRISNIFDREQYNADIIVSLVHTTIAELDRFTAYAAILANTPDELLEDLSIERLIMREDVLPPVPESDNEEDQWTP